MKRTSSVVTSPWSVLFFLTACSVYIYALMEWIFFVTKPSFMSGMSLWHQIQILLLSALGMSIVPLAIIFLLGLMDRGIRHPLADKVLVAIGILVPTVILSSLLLILIDNFTYTVFRFGIVSTERFLRAGYTLLLFIFVDMFIPGFGSICTNEVWKRTR